MEDSQGLLDMDASGAALAQHILSYICTYPQVNRNMCKCETCIQRYFLFNEIFKKLFTCFPTLWIWEVIDKNLVVPRKIFLDIKTAKSFVHARTQTHSISVLCLGKC